MLTSHERNGAWNDYDWICSRVSTDGQTLAAQTEALHGAGCARIFAEKISGAYSDRRCVLPPIGGAVDHVPAPPLSPSGFGFASALPG